MIKPLLHLLQRGDLDSKSRRRIIEALMDHHCDPIDQTTRPLDAVHNIVIVMGLEADNPLDVLAHALSRYPQLACLHVSVHSPAPSDHPNNEDTGHLAICLSDADLMVCAPSSTEGLPAILEAMAAGVPVLIPDTPSPDSAFMKDGVNGFLYRAHDPDSLALSLLTLQSVSRDILKRVTSRALETISEHARLEHSYLASKEA